MTLVFKKAEIDDCKAIYDLVFSRVHWMDEVGLKQWNVTKYDERYPYSYFEKNINSFYVLKEDNEIIATAALYDSDIRWFGFGNDAFYIHHLSSKIGKSGAGRIFLNKAEIMALNVGKKYLRLDSAVDNEKLAKFYTELGYLPKGECSDGLYHGILREKIIQ